MANEKISIRFLRYTDDNIPQFQKPTIVGYYSVDHEGKFCGTLKGLKYIKYDQYNVNFDLNIGFKQYISKPEEIENEEKLNKLVIWLSRGKFMHKIFNDSQEEYNFISYRGSLTTIMRTPYEKLEDWIIYATKVKNTIFLCTFNGNVRKAKLQRGMTDMNKLLTFGGKKFEQYMLSEAPDKDPNTSIPVNANEEFCLIFRNKLKGKNLIYGAEVDGIESDEPITELNLDIINLKKFIELKTSAEIKNKKRNRSFERYKLLKWWSQCFVAGIDELVCGFRNNQRIVCKLKKFKVQDMPSHLWSANSCIQFLDDCLELILKTLKHEPDFTYWQFDWAPTWEYVQKQKLPKKSEYEFLPDWFIKECKHCSQ